MGRLARRLPDWIRFEIPSGTVYTGVKKVLAQEGLSTVCIEARCPNAGNCFCRGTATFLALGSICTRNCRYCSVEKGIPHPLTLDEGERIARAVKKLSLSYTVITSVTRDDIADGGASVFASIVRCIRRESPSCKIELLIPDFKQSVDESLEKIFSEKPDVINHNIEVVPSLFNELRPLGNYNLSLAVLKNISSRGFTAKSGLMIGFGETKKEILSVFSDLRSAGVSHLTVGQYLQSTRDGFPVHTFYTPDEFEELRLEALKCGFTHVACAPLVRSSYHAEEFFNETTV